MRYAILATGPSMSQAVADAVRGRCKVIAVSDAYRLAPWADALVSADAAWWRHHAPEFAGRRISNSRVPMGERLAVPHGINSGALAVWAALEMGASEIVLLGFDGHGTHFFGPHPDGLKNTTDARREVHFIQHRNAAKECKRAGVAVWNCSEGSVIDAYEKRALEDVFC